MSSPFFAGKILSPLPPVVFLISGELTHKDGIMNGLLGGGEIAPMMVTPQVTGFNPALQPYPYDPERAKKLVAEAKAAGVPVDTTPLKILARRGAY